MATYGAPTHTEFDVEGERGALQDGLQRESLRRSEAGTTSRDEYLPPLLKKISTGDYSFMECDSPYAHATINISDLDFGDPPKGLDNWEHDVELIKDKGTFFSHDASGCKKPEASIIDVPKLPPVKLNPSNRSTAKSGGLLTPKSILSKRGGHLFTPHGASLTPRGSQAEGARKVSFRSIMPEGDDDNKTNLANGEESAATYGSPQPHKNSTTTHDASKTTSKRKFFSQPMPTPEKLVGMMREKGSTYSGPVRRCTTNSPNDSNNAKKENYDIFRTRSAKFERQLSRRNSRLDDPSLDGSSKSGCDEGKAVPAGRYFDALKGPELEFVKDSEELLLPLDQKWPFLLRFPIGCFGICLGLGSQAMLWKNLATLSSMSFLKIPLAINFVVWCMSVMALLIISVTYSLKCLLYFEAVRREYYHPVRVNFFFAPWIACMFLTLGIPPRIATTIHPAIWCIFTTPLLLLKLKIYGQWLSGGQRRLSKVANPSTHLSLVGNFVSALLAAIVGWDEPAIFFWAVGCAHYLVVFVTLYQRLPTAEVLPKELHPVFFLFVAAPSVASVAWKTIAGNFDRLSRVAYFLGLFLYSSLVVRVNFFRGFQFSITWWAYTFPMASSAIATMHYSLEVHNPITQSLAVVLSGISSITVLGVFVSTLYHALKGSLFPNDVAIAITRKKHKRKQKGPKLDSSLENKTEDCEDDSTKLYLPSEGGTIVASLQNGLISVTSDPYPVSENSIDRDA
uniref:Slow anion channel-associated 1a n=1 Tax=Polypodium vulgare TaxID=58048 RepID=A0A977P151_POLVU|nr:slow anion channel-associated 1a [Polypodium vulgare]